MANLFCNDDANWCKDDDNDIIQFYLSCNDTDTDTLICLNNEQILYKTKDNCNKSKTDFSKSTCKNLPKMTDYLKTPQEQSFLSIIVTLQKLSNDQKKILRGILKTFLTQNKNTMFNGSIISTQNLQILHKYIDNENTDILGIAKQIWGEKKNDSPPVCPKSDESSDPKTLKAAQGDQEEEEAPTKATTTSVPTKATTTSVPTKAPAPTTSVPTKATTTSVPTKAPAPTTSVPTTSVPTKAPTTSVPTKAPAPTKAPTPSPTKAPAPTTSPTKAPAPATPGGGCGGYNNGTFLQCPESGAVFAIQNSKAYWLSPETHTKLGNPLPKTFNCQAGAVGGWYKGFGISGCSLASGQPIIDDNGNLAPDDDDVNVATAECTAPTDNEMEFLQTTNDLIGINRANIKNISMFQETTEKEYFKTVVTKWIWLIFLLLYIIILIIIYILRDKTLLVNIFLLSTCILAIVLLCIGMFALIRMTM